MSILFKLKQIQWKLLAATFVIGAVCVGKLGASGTSGEPGPICQVASLNSCSSTYGDNKCNTQGFQAAAGTTTTSGESCGKCAHGSGQFSDCGNGPEVGGNPHE